MGQLVSMVQIVLDGSVGLNGSDSFRWFSWFKWLRSFLMVWLVKIVLDGSIG